MCHIFFIHLSVDGHLNSFQRLAIMTMTAVNIGVQVCVWTYVFNPPVYIHLEVKLLGHVLTFLGNCQTVFHSSRPILHSHSQCEGSISPYPLQHLLLSFGF